MELTPGTRISLSGDSTELWIQGYNVRGDSEIAVEIESFYFRPR